VISVCHCTGHIPNTSPSYWSCRLDSLRPGQYKLGRNLLGTMASYLKTRNQLLHVSVEVMNVEEDDPSLIVLSVALIVVGSVATAPTIACTFLPHGILQV
jgi:hypothetical protein